MIRRLQEVTRMKKLLLLFVLLAATTMFASSIDFANSGGSLTGDASGLALTGSTLTMVGNFNGSGLLVGDLGSFAFTTGALASGSLQTGATFASGGSLTVTGNGNGGLPTGVLFSGTFSSSNPVSWNLITLADGTHNYTLQGALEGTLSTGQHVDGATVQLTMNTGMGFFDGSINLASGNTNIESGQLAVPEPGSLGLVGTGLFGMALFVRHRFVR